MVIDELKQFLSQAEKGRKYAPNYALGIRAALGYFEKELNDEEKESIENFLTNFDAIYSNVIRNNQNKLSLATLEVYKRRVFRLLNDYQKYSSDPAKFVAWSPARRMPTKKAAYKKNEVSSSDKDMLGVQIETDLSNKEMVRNEIPLRQGVKAVISFPSDLNNDDVRKIRLYIDYLESLTKNI